MKKILLILLCLFGVILSGCTPKIDISEKNGDKTSDLGDSEVVTAIQEDYLKATGAYDDYSTHNVFVSYTGPFTHNDKTSYICFITATYMMYTQALWSETIDGLTFSYRNGNRYQVYYDHHFYTLQEGFDLELIDHHDLLTIYNPENHNYQVKINNI